ncbi:MAG: acyl-CoA dehydrogenase [Desulfuromonas sp.]|nr:MAG: acyl-CoA dehydrogenase [Desulfuromonas sp.]
MPAQTNRFDTTTKQPFTAVLGSYKKHLRQLFHERIDIDKASTRRGIAPFVLREIMAPNPFATYIHKDYGGRGGAVHEGLALTAAAGYESLPLALGFGINWALFLQPVTKYAQEEAKRPVFEGFLQERRMGGLMITEPDYGSDALHMKTAYTEDGDHYHLQGSKHWAGLTGWADYWLLTARKMSASGTLGRDVDFFICDVSQPQQQIHVEEVYENLGIYLLPYGRNRIDVRIPTLQRLQPRTTGIKMMLDLLHRSRMQFPGMAMGFIQRLLDEAIAHCKERHVGGRSLFSYDQVQQRISRLQAAYTIASAMCFNSSSKAGIENDLSGAGLEANAVKTCITDLMQESAQSLLQLVGAKGYRLDHIAGRALVDSRPFQIFEGSNDILYIQIAEAIQKLMQREKETNLRQFLGKHPLTTTATERLKDLLDFNLALPLTQRKLTEFGCLISRIVAMNLVLQLEESNYNRTLIDNAVTSLRQEIAALLSHFSSVNSTTCLEDYAEESSWLESFLTDSLRGAR